MLGSHIDLTGKGEITTDDLNTFLRLIQFGYERWYRRHLSHKLKRKYRYDEGLDEYLPENSDQLM